MPPESPMEDESSEVNSPDLFCEEDWVTEIDECNKNTNNNDVEIIQEDLSCSVLMKALPHNLMKEKHALELQKLPRRTFLSAGPEFDLAKSRDFNYRGRACNQFRPKPKAKGIIRMMNRSLARPSGLNEIVRINPKYNIVLEDNKRNPVKGALNRGMNGVKGGNGLITNGPKLNGIHTDKNGDDNYEMSSSQYVLRNVRESGRGNAEKTGPAFSSLVLDPCNTDVFPLRAKTLKPAVLHNVDENWPLNGIIPVNQAVNFALKEFDITRWQAGEITTEEYMNNQHCQVIVLVGVLTTPKSVTDKFLKKTCNTFRLNYVPTRPQAAEQRNSLYLTDDEGKFGVHLLPSPYSGLNPEEIVNGIPCAVKGFSVPGHTFVVSEVEWATPKPCVWPSLDQNCTNVDMVFISGLKLSLFEKPTIELDLLTDYLLGLCGSPSEQLNQLRSKTKVFILGNSYKISSRSPPFTPTRIQEEIEATEKLDSFLDQLAETLEVFFMPGWTDATDEQLPQSPFRPVMFPKLSQRSAVSSLSNPCRVQVKLFENETSSESSMTSIDMILSSGSNVQQVRNYLGDESALLIGENMLKWGHLNPAGPDFFPINGSPQTDVLGVLESVPHLYVIGNEQEFGLREFNNCKIVSLPSFDSSHQVVTLEQCNGAYRIVPIEFKVFDFESV